MGKNHHNYGKHLSAETKRKIAKTKMGSKNPMWKGDEATEGTMRWRLRRDIPVPKGSDRHHIDGNGRNSESSNILILSRREHMIKDGRMEALIKRNKMGRGRKHSPETIEKMSAVHSGSNLSPETIEKMRNAQRGRKHISETIEKMSAFAKTRKRDEKGRFLNARGGS